MQNFDGKVAFITGGASGVGLGQAKVFSDAGCRVVIADIRAEPLAEAKRWFLDRAAAIHTITLDITDRDAYRRAADEVEAVFGPVELLFNTAGVSAFGPLEQATYADYDWQMAVNFGGVVNGLQTFVPRMIANGRGGHIVNTASLASFFPSEAAGIYSASKYAVRGLTESLRLSLAKYDIGVSVLCPASVATNIADALDTRPEELGDGYAMDAATRAAYARLYATGMDPVELAVHVKAAITNNALYIIPFPEERERIAAQFEAILASFPPEDSDPEGIARRREGWAAFIGERAAESSPGEP